MKKNLRFLQNFLLSFVLFTGCTFSAFAQDWNQLMKVTASDRLSLQTSVDGYGRSVGLSGDYAFSGGFGTVMIAKYVNNDWAHIGKLQIAGDTDFGRGISVSGGYLLISGSSGTYIYKQDTGSPDNWVLLKKLNSGPLNTSSIYIHGSYVIVGGSYEPYNEPGQTPIINAGAAYIFEKNTGGPDNWGQIKKLTAPVKSVNNLFGLSVTISDDYALVGSRTEATIFRKDKNAPGDWGSIQSIAGPRVDPDVYETRDFSVAIEGDYAVIGIPYEDFSFPDEGAAYIYKKDAANADNWNLLQKIRQPDHSLESNFGSAVAIEGAFIVVGAPSEGGGRGAVQVFIKASDGTDQWDTGKVLDAKYPYESALGISVAISGDNIIGGAINDQFDTGDHRLGGYGAAYFFRKDFGGTEAWGQVKVLRQRNYKENPNDHYGYSVAISGDYAVVGTPLDEAMQGTLEPVLNAGSAYVLHNNSGHWEEVKKILPPVRYEERQFGFVVAIDGDNILISEGDEESDYTTSSGSSYLFSKNQGGTDNWGLVKRFTADIPANYDKYGKSILIKGNYAIVGAPRDGRYIDPVTNSVTYPGAVYIFEKNTGGVNNWGLSKKIPAQDPVNSSEFGDLVAFDENQLLATDRGGRGSLYVFGKDTGGIDQWGKIKKITNYLSANPIGGYNPRIALSGNNALVCTDENKLRIYGKDQGGTNNWGRVKELPNPLNVPLYTSSVAISDEYAVLGVIGSAHIYKKDQGGENQWGYVQTITAAAPAVNGIFGHAAAIEGNTILIGAFADNLDANDSYPFRGAGSVYFFKNTPRPAANVRINAGGADFQTSDGNEFIADQYYSGAGRITTIPATDILNTTDDALYFNKRFGYSFNYKVPVVNGTVKVVLHFAEIYWGVDGRKALGKRRFHVDIEGSRKLTNYEIFVAAGGSLTAVQESFVVTVTDGILNLDFVSGAADVPAISAIEVLPAEYRTLATKEDSYVRNGKFADDNFGQDVTMHVKKSLAEGYARNSYLKFPLENIPSVNSAKLRIYGQHVDNTNRVTLLAYGATDDSWTENGITWNNAPASSGSVVGKDRITNYSGYFEIDVTSFIKSELAGDKVASLVLKAGQNDQLILNSSENVSYPPQLIIESLRADNPASAIRMGEKEERIVEVKVEPAASRIFPNPARKKFKIAISEQHKGKVNVQLTSLSGRTFDLTKSGTQNNASEMDIDISSMQLSQGIYVLKIHSVAATETIKLLVVE